jgi:diguanylate cyclase (GGDEF)-like protein
MSMFRDDGVLLARHPFLEQAIGQSFGGKLIVAEGAGVTGQTRGMSPVDGQEKFIFSAHLANFPIALRVGRSVEAVLAPWRRQAWALGSTAAALDGGLLALIVLGVRHLRGQRSLALALAAQAKAEACERGERDLREQYACFGNALDNMVQGLCLFDRDDRLIVMNARFADLHAVPDHLRRPGSTLGDLLDHFAASDCEGALRPASTSACTTPRLARTFTFDLPDGRTLTVVHAPIPAGGWLCTHEDVSEQRNREAQIAFLARHDALTGLPNRVPLGEWLDEILAHQDGRSAAVLCLDLDGFKFVNDTLGHPAGDELLRRVARRLKNTVGVADLIARLGGDEFVVVRTAATSTIDFAPLCEQIIEAMHRPFDVHGQSVTIGTSIGVATIATTEPNRDALLRCADMALYQAKALGRGTWCAFDPAMDAEAQRRRYLVDDLRRALDQDQFELHYQPLVEAGTRALRGFEALLRWRHPERGLVSPAEFIPLAEETGLIRMIGAWVVRRACLDAASWPESLKIAINLSPVQFVQSNLVEQIKQAIVSSGIAATRVELEITEAILLQDSSMVLDTLHCLRNLGVRISMDDFGTGYSSLSYLRSFPFDKIKIDQSFVRSLERDPEGVEIIRAVVSLGKALGMAVLAEGVETAEQHEILRREGCDELQGYLFSRPKPHAEAIEIFENEASWRCAS